MKTPTDHEFTMMLEKAVCIYFDIPGYHEVIIEPLSDGHWGSSLTRVMQCFPVKGETRHCNDERVTQVVVASMLTALRDLDYYREDMYDKVKIEIAPGVKDIYVHMKALKGTHKLWQKTLSFTLKRVITPNCLGKIQAISPCRVTVMGEIPNK